MNTIKTRNVSPETRIGTRIILRQMEGRRYNTEKLDGKKLNSKEVAAYIVKSSRNMWIAAQNAGLDDVAKQIEGVFCYAFAETGVKIDAAILQQEQAALI